MLGNLTSCNAMQLKPLNKLLLLCEKNGILRVEKSTTHLHYGPLGSLLKRNIFNEWLSSLLGSQEFPVFPLEVQTPREEHIFQNDGSTFQAALDSCDKLFGAEPPFGYALYGPCVNVAAEPDPTDFGFLRGLQGWTRLSLLFRCPPSRSDHWFHFWSKQRHIWWRKLSSIPSQFSLSSEDTKRLCVQLETPWGCRLPLESISLCGHLVACHLELEAAVLAYLANSCSDRGEAQVLQLHSRLSPYQVCFWAEEGELLRGAAAHLAQQMKGVSVFPLVPSDLPFSRFDEMGIPYTVVLGKSSLTNGIAGLRSRDTTLQEQVHIAELTEKLKKYLKI